MEDRPNLIQPFRLSPADVDRYVAIRRTMLQTDPWSFDASPDADRGQDVEHVTKMLARDDYAIFAVEGENGELVATAGVIRKSGKFAHRAGVWGVYVAHGHRGRGYGRAVMEAVVDLARTWDGVYYLDLGVSERAVEAHALYESLDFEAWGREPESTEVDGVRYDEIFMCLQL